MNEPRVYMILAFNTRKILTLPLRAIMLAVISLAFSITNMSIGNANDFSRPWKNSDEALVIDAYEKNAINWAEVVKDRKIRAFIGKSSDGLPPPYKCRQSTEAQRTLCKKTFQNYWLKRELYHTRKTAAKSMGLKWGAYHLGRPGNPIEQANHFIKFADPQPDELIALDIEHDDPAKWISFADAEIFARHIKERLGRYPVLYTNHDTAKRIAKQRRKYPLLSRLPLWYARYKEDIRNVFPLGNWDRYALWQFSSHLNCNKRKCLYRVKGTHADIDVNATGLTLAQFDKAWPFNRLANGNPAAGGGTEVRVAKVPAKKKRPVNADATRFAVSYMITLGENKKHKLTSIAIPTPRHRDIPVNAIDPMIVGSVNPGKQVSRPARPMSLYPHRQSIPALPIEEVLYPHLESILSKSREIAVYPRGELEKPASAQSALYPRRETANVYYPSAAEKYGRFLLNPNHSSADNGNFGPRITKARAIAITDAAYRNLAHHDERYTR